MDGNTGVIELTGVKPISISAWRVDGAASGVAAWSGTLEVAGRDLSSLFGFLGRTVALRLQSADAVWSGSARITSLPMTAAATATASVQIEGSGPLVVA